MPSLPPKVKVFWILEENCWKIKMKVFPCYLTWKLEFVSYFCPWLLLNLILILLGQHCTGKKSAMLSQYSLDNLAQIKPLCNVVLKAPDNITQEKFCSLLSQVKTLCCSTGYRQHRMVRNPVQCCLNTIWSHLCNFYFGLVNFLIISGYCKLYPNIEQKDKIV